MDDAYEETGWKLVHGDIFRPPQHRAFFVANLGAGIQLIAMSVSLGFTRKLLSTLLEFTLVMVITYGKLSVLLYSDVKTVFRVLQCSLQ